MTIFDPYHKWLGIKPKDQPPHHYRLLGIDLFEDDPEVIEAAVDRLMAYVQQCSIGEHLKESQQILNELSTARVCLLNLDKKEKYDAELRNRLEEPEIISKKVSDSAITPEVVVQLNPEIAQEELPEIILTSPSEQKQEVHLPEKQIKAGLHVKWIVAGGVCLLLLSVLLVLQFKSSEKVAPVHKKIVANGTFPKVDDTQSPKVELPIKTKIKKDEERPESKPVKEPTEKSPSPIAGKTFSPPKVSIPVATDPKYFDPNWIEQRLNQIGIDTLIREYASISNKDVQIIKTTLDLSRDILKRHPEALREQLQARLINQTQPAFAAFQKLPNNRLRFRSEWATFQQSDELLFKTLDGYAYNVKSVAVTPDGKQIISASDGKSLKVWNISDGKLFRTHSGFQTDSGQTRSIQTRLASIDCMILTLDGKQAITGSSDNTIRIQDISNGVIDRILTGHKGAVTCLKLTPDGTKLLSGSNDRTIKLWDISSGKLLNTFQGHFSRVTCVTVTPDGKEVVSGSYDRTLKIWDISNGQLLRTFSKHLSQVSCVLVTPDGNYVFSGSGTGKVIKWNLKTGKLDGTLTAHSRSLTDLLLTSDGKQLISSSGDKSLKVWDPKLGQLLKTISGDSISCVTLTPDDKFIVTGGKRIKIWNLNPSNNNLQSNGHSSRITCLALTPDGRKIVSGSHDKTVKVWDFSTGKLLQTFMQHTGGIGCLDVTPDGSQVISGSGDNTLKLWSIQNGQLNQTLSGHSRYISSIAVTADGQRGVSCSEDGTTRVWNLTSGKLVRKLSVKTGGATCVALHPNGKKIITGSIDRTLKVWSIASSKRPRTLTGHLGSITCVAVTPNGKQVVSGSLDKTLKVWGYDKGKQLYSLTGHSGYIHCVVLTSDGKKAISGSSDKTIKVWDITNGNILDSYELDDAVFALAVSSDGKTLFAGCSSGRIHKLTMLMPGETTVKEINKTPQPKPVPSTTPKPVPSFTSQPDLLIAPFSNRKATNRQRLWARHLKSEVIITNSIEMNMVLIPSGEFRMGSGKSTSEITSQFRIKGGTGDNVFNQEHPQHRVKIDKPFYLSATVVTQKQWKAVMNSSPWKGKKHIKEGDTYPATYVSWNDVQEFIQKLNQKEGVTYRLPSEAEWEYACRAGSESMYYFGESTTTLREHAWLNKNTENIGKQYAHQVGKKKPNVYGLFDMHGNVWEWCGDWYDKSYYNSLKEKVSVNPQGPASGLSRVMRGGSFHHSPQHIRSAYRYSYSPSESGGTIGFRLIKRP